MSATFRAAENGSTRRSGAQRSSHAVASLLPQGPVYKQVIPWLLFWPLLCLIARQAPYFSGPPRDANFNLPGMSGGTAAYRGSLYLNMAFECICLLSARQEIWATLRRHPLMLASLGLVLLSVLWSGTPWGTVNMWIEVCLCTGFACFLAVRFPAEQLMALLMFMGVSAALLSLLFVIALPAYGVSSSYAAGAWQGICDHKNTLGLSMTYLLTPVFFIRRITRSQRLLYGALILFLIIMSQSRGAWLYATGTLLFACLLQCLRRVRKQEAALITVAALTLLIVMCVAAISSIDVLAPLLGKSASMSGRTGIYREVWQSIMKEPLLGYGYGGFWGQTPEAARIGISIGWTRIGYAESGVLELLLQLGFVGAGLVMAMLVRAIVQGVSLLRSPAYTPRAGWFLTLLFVAVVTNIDAGWLLVPGTLDWVLILIACIGLDAETRTSLEAFRYQGTPTRRFSRLPLSVMRAS